MKEIRKVSIIGMGAVGMMYGERIADTKGLDALDFIVDEGRYESYCKREFRCNGKVVPFRVCCDRDAEPADLVIVAVKATGLAAAIDSIEKAVGPETIIISILNGITSEEYLSERYGAEKVVHCVVQGMDSMKIGDELKYINFGEIRLGITKTGLKENLDSLTSFLDECSIPYTVEDDIMRRLWGKLMCNVGINQICCAYNIPYGEATTEGGAPFRSLIAAMREVIAVAAAEGITLTEDDLNGYIRILRGLDPLSYPSMAQDRINRRKTELDLFAGTIVRLGEKNGIQVPENKYLFEIISEIDNSYV